MKKRLTIIILSNTLFIFQINAQNISNADSLNWAHDSTFLVDHFKYKIGIKIMTEHSGDRSMKPTTNQVYNAGIQVIKPLGLTPSSIETGLYLITKSSEPSYYTHTYHYDSVMEVGYTNTYSNSIVFHYYNLSIPFNYRFDSRFVYGTAGVMIDYLIGEQNGARAGELDSLHYNSGDMRKFNWGYNLTLGAERCFNTKLRFFAEIRYARTLSSAKTTDGDFFVDPSYLNWGLALGANYKLY